MNNDPRKNEHDHTPAERAVAVAEDEHKHRIKIQVEYEGPVMEESALQALMDFFTDDVATTLNARIGKGPPASPSTFSIGWHQTLFVDEED